MQTLVWGEAEEGKVFLTGVDFAGETHFCRAEVRDGDGAVLSFVAHHVLRTGFDFRAGCFGPWLWERAEGFELVACGDVSWSG